MDRKHGLLAAFIAHPRSHPTYLGYLNGFVYGFGLGASMLVFPLYAIELGFRLSDQGIIVAAPALFMVMLRLPGGAISDRFGEKIILWFSFTMVIAASLIAAFSSSLLPLIIAQLFNGASRSVYWSAGQSYISRSAEGDAGKVMGRQLSFESTGGIIGLIVGLVAEGAGFTTAFLVMAGVSAIGFTITSSLPPLPRKDQVRSFKASFAPAKHMLVHRRLLHAHMVAFMAAAHSGLMGGLFIAFFRDAGYDIVGTTIFRSFNSLGVASLAYFFGILLARLGSRNTGTIGISLTGLLAIAIGVTGELPVVPYVLMVVIGMTFGSLRALYPSLAAENSAPNQRAMALSVVSLYWAIAMLLSPLFFGFLADATTILTAIYVFGGFAIVAGLLSPLVHSFAQGGRGDSDSAPPSA